MLHSTLAKFPVISYPIKETYNFLKTGQGGESLPDCYDAMENYHQFKGEVLAKYKAHNAQVNAVIGGLASAFLVDWGKVSITNMVAGAAIGEMIGGESGAKGGAVAGAMGGSIVEGALIGGILGGNGSTIGGAVSGIAGGSIVEGALIGNAIDNIAKKESND